MRCGKRQGSRRERAWRLVPSLSDGGVPYILPLDSAEHGYAEGQASSESIRAWRGT